MALTRNEITKRYRARHGAKLFPRRRELQKLAYIADPEKFKCKKLKKNFGITCEEYHAVLEKQNGCCAICFGIDEDVKLAVDHDHETGKIRGLLCRSCNVGIGHLKDSKTVLASALAYLEKWKEN